MMKYSVNDISCIVMKIVYNHLLKRSLINTQKYNTIESIDGNLNFDFWGCDQYDIMQIVMDCEEALLIIIDDGDMEKIQSPIDIITIILQEK